MLTGADGSSSKYQVAYSAAECRDVFGPMLHIKWLKMNGTYGDHSDLIFTASIHALLPLVTHSAGH